MQATSKFKDTCRSWASTVKARNNALGGNVSKHLITGRYFGPGHYLGPGRYLGPVNEFFSQVSAQYVLHQKTCAHACIPYKMCGHVSMRGRPGRLHGRRQLHGSNVLTCCTWVRTRRVGVISDGHYYGLLRNGTL